MARTYDASRTTQELLTELTGSERGQEKAQRKLEGQVKEEMPTIADQVALTALTDLTTGSVLGGSVPMFRISRTFGIGLNGRRVLAEVTTLESLASETRFERFFVERNGLGRLFGPSRDITAEQAVKILQG